MGKIALMFLLAVLVVIPNVRAEKEIKYAISDIVPELKENAKAVVRFERREFELKSDSKATEKVTYAVSVLNENGLAQANFMEYYNRFMQIGHISATVYDAEGAKLHRIKQEDILDLSASSGEAGYDDNRMKVFDPQTKDYPFTIEYEFETDYNGLFNFPLWYLFKDYNVSVEKAEFVVKASKLDDIRIKQRNLEVQPVESQEDNLNVKSWTISNYKARIAEPFSENIREYTPVIQLAPTVINFGGVKNEFQSWEDLGLFINVLNTGRDKLPEETVKKMQELTQDASTDYDKIKMIYEYMQNKTRYVSIQEGIGGWQTIEAGDVNRLGYGDCKALTNYMEALLNAVGIKSVYTLVYAGDNARILDRDFPANQFNHVILCVPQAQDTIWLECTSQQIPCGYISTFTDDRDVLLVEKEGGKIVRTKAYSQDDNQASRRVMVELDDAGNAMVDVTTRYSGICYDDMFPIFQMDKTDQEKYLRNRINIPNFSLLSYSHENSKKQIPHVDESLHLALRSYGSRIGSRMVIPLNLMNKVDEVPAETPDRESGVIVRRSVQEVDTVVYRIPEGYKLEKVPDAVSISTKYGNYEASAVVDGNTIVYSRKLALLKGHHPSEDYPALRSFIAAVYKADQMKCLMVKM